MHVSRRNRQSSSRWKWDATASASRASSPPRSSRTTTSAASSGRFDCAVRAGDRADRAWQERGGARSRGKTLCRAHGRRHRRAARRPRRAAWRHVRRHGTDRHPASRRGRRAQPEAGPDRISGTARRRRAADRTGRRRCRIKSRRMRSADRRARAGALAGLAWAARKNTRTSVGERARRLHEQVSDQADAVSRVRHGG